MHIRIYTCLSTNRYTGIAISRGYTIFFLYRRSSACTRSPTCFLACTRWVRRCIYIYMYICIYT